MRSQRGVGFHRRAVDADPLALHQTVLGDQSQNPAEDLLMDLVRQAAARLRQPGMIGNLVAARQVAGTREATANPNTARAMPRSLSIPSK